MTKHQMDMLTSYVSQTALCLKKSVSRLSIKNIIVGAKNVPLKKNFVEAKWLLIF